MTHRERRIRTCKRWWTVAVVAAGLGAAPAQEVRRALPLTSEPAAAGAADTELAAFLAGRTVSPSNLLGMLQRTPAYGGHGAEMEKLWTHFDTHYFTPMRAWSAAELAPRADLSRPVLYYFGGPDAISAMAFFPEARAYVLVGLEPPGEVPPPTGMSPEALTEALAGLRKAVEVSFSFGHFITNDMRTDLNRAAFKGVLPILLTAVGLTGGEILSTTYIAVGADGTARPLGSLGRAGAGELTGVQIVFRRFPIAPQQTLSYLRADLSDAGLAKNPGVLPWAASFGTPNAYLKAASYLLHGPGFRKATDDILGRSAIVLQDDSGIPVRVFNAAGWRLWFFGSYAGTLGIFSKHEQPALRAAFAGAPELPFGTGYKWRKGESNLMLAIRPASALPALPAIETTPRARPTGTPLSSPPYSAPGPAPPMP